MLISIKDGEILKNGAAAAELVSRRFASNFIPRCGAEHQLSKQQIMANDDNDNLVLNCFMEDVIRVIRTSPSSTAGLDGYSFNMIKQQEFSIKVPLLKNSNTSFKKKFFLPHGNMQKFYLCIRAKVMLLFLARTGLLVCAHV